MFGCFVCLFACPVLLVCLFVLFRVLVCSLARVVYVFGRLSCVAVCAVLCGFMSWFGCVVGCVA